MKTFFKFFTLAIFSFVSLGFFWNTFALDPINLQAKTLNASYNSLSKRLDTRYKKLFPFSQSEYSTINTLESNIESAYRNGDIPLKWKDRLKALTAIRKATNSLNSYVLSIERSRKKTATATSTTAATPKPNTSEIIPSVPEVAWTNADILYYADAFEWEHTSLGDTFRQSGFSAARCNVPLGTLLQVWYGGKAVLVKANDRPNCEKHPDIVDTTTETFSTLASLSAGRLKGSFIPLGKLDGTKEYLSTDFFKSFNVALDEKLPNILMLGETFNISGKVTNGSSDSILYILAPDGGSKTLSQATDNLWRFHYTFTPTIVGTYQFVVAGWLSFSGAKWLSIRVINPADVAGKKFISTAIQPISTIQADRVEGSDLTPTQRISFDELPTNTFKTIQIQGQRASIKRSSMEDIDFSPSELSIFSPGETAHVDVLAQKSSTPFSIDTYWSPVSVLSEDYVLGSAYSKESHEPIITSLNGANFTLKFSGEPSAKIRSEAYIITPKGSVDHVNFGAGTIGKWSKFEYTLTEAGTYLVEVMYETGFPAYIGPISYGKTLAILPNPYDLVNKDIWTITPKTTENILNSINSIRDSLGLAPVWTDATLSKVATLKATDMAENNYVGHTDSAWEKIDGTAQRNGITLHGSIGENVAGWTVSAEYLQAGLSLSGWHRANMIGNWTKVGIWIIQKSGKVFVVEVFGE